MQNKLNHKNEEISRLLLKIEEKNPRQMLAFIAWSSIWSMVYICHVFFYWKVSVSLFSVYRIPARRPLISTTITIHVLIFIYVVTLCCSRLSPSVPVGAETNSCSEEDCRNSLLQTKQKKFCFVFVSFYLFFFFVCWLFFSDKLWFTPSYFRTWLNTNWSVMCKNPLANLSSIIRYTNRKKLPASINVSFML